jgi:hypothetical protein
MKRPRPPRGCRAIGKKKKKKKEREKFNAKTPSNLIRNHFIQRKNTCQAYENTELTFPHK